MSREGLTPKPSPGKQPEYEGPRIAPSPESIEEPVALNIAVVIPCMNEGLGIIHTIESIAAQRKKASNQFVQGVVVVINNRPDSSPEVLQSNLKTYAALQSIKFGYGLRTGDRELDEKIERIQQSNIRIEVVDAFSEGHANPESNVGWARQIGSEHALSTLDKRERKGARSTEKPVLMSTDADTMLGPEALDSVWSMFWSNTADAISLHTQLASEYLDADSMEAYQRINLYWLINSGVHEMDDRMRALKGREFYMPNQIQIADIEKGLVTLGGASTAYSAEAYERSGGYKPLGTAEDTELGYSIVEAGGTVKKADWKDHKKAVVITQPRISTRTDRGFGHTIGRFAPHNGDFSNIAVAHPDIARDTTAFFKDFENLQKEQPEKISEESFRILCSNKGLLEEETNDLWEIYLAWDGTPNKREHHEFIRETHDAFEEMHGKVTFEGLLQNLESNNKDYWQTSGEIIPGIKGDEGAFHEMWSWESFKEEMPKLIHDLGIGVGNAPQDTADAFKIRAIVAGAYAPMYTQILQSFWIFSTRELLDLAQKQGITGPKTAVFMDMLSKSLSKSAILSQEAFVALTLALHAQIKSQVYEYCENSLGATLAAEQKKKLQSAQKKQKDETAVLWHDFEAMEKDKALVTPEL